MKIAICFSGSIRDFPSCLPSLKRYVLDNLNADVFLHLWKMDDVTKLETDVNFKWRNDTCSEKYVIEQLKPLRYVVDTYSDQWEEKIIKESGVDISKFTDDKLRNYGTNACGMYYKIFKAHELMEKYTTEKKIRYDVVIRARLDFIWEDNVFMEDFINIDNDHVYLVRDRYATHSRLSTNDKFFAGSMDVMHKMCNLFNCISHYQSRGLMVEGQTLHENHIKFSGLQVKWIGHSHTYYKCMGRHCINNNNGIILINNENNLANFWFEMSYYLLYNNYGVIYLNHEPQNKYISILTTFPHFKFNDGIIPLNMTVCLIGQSQSKVFNIEQIIINGIADGNKTTQITINENICTNELKDFVYSIITTNKYGGAYSFKNKEIIYDINMGDKVIFKYMDRGYYLSTLVSYDSAKKKYKLQVGNEHINGLRENIKIFDLLKYYKKNSAIMPVNVQQHNSPVF